MESDLVRSWMQKMRVEGCFVERNSALDLSSGRGLQRIGLPDIIACYRSRYVAIEAKRDFPNWLKWFNDKSEQSPAQKLCLSEVRKAGGVGICTYTYAHVATIIEMLSAGIDSQTINETIDRIQKDKLG